MSSTGEPLHGAALGRDMLQWLDQENHLHTAPADKRATGLRLQNASVYRQPNKYPHRRNYQGYYWFSRTGEHLWYESFTEYSALMWLDFSQPIVGISTQPVRIFFADGSSHCPDIFTVERDGIQTLYDVRPEPLIDDDTREIFGKTARLCQRIGWAYQILGELRLPMRHNLEWVAAYRHPRFQPPPDIQDAVLGYLREPARLVDVARAVSPEAPAFSVHYLYHLLWNRTIHANLTLPLSWSTLLERGDYA